MRIVGKCEWTIAHCTRIELVFLHGGLVSHAQVLVFFLLHACIEVEKCCMDTGTPNRSRLKMHDLIA